MINLNNPFGVNYENGIEDNITVQCDNCRHYTILPYYYDKDLDIERETDRIKHHYKDNDRIKLQCKLIPKIYKKYRRHPDKIIVELISSYWSAWDYDVANDNGVDNLIGYCYNCNKILKHERISIIRDIIQNETED